MVHVDQVGRAPAVVRRASRSVVGILVVLAVAVAVACGPTNGPPPTAAGWTSAPALTAGTTPAVVGTDRIECGSPTSCLVLPVFAESGEHGPATAGEAWDGRAWRPVPSPGANQYGFSCAGDWCLVVNGPRPGEVRASTWDGRAWHEIAAPGQVSALDCPAPDRCLAVAADARTVVRWDGTTWTTVSGNRTGDGTLSAVTCASPTSCLFTVNRGGRVRGVEHWDGTAWRATDTGGELDWAAAPACAGPTRCFLTANRQGPDGQLHAVLLAWDGVGWSDTGGAGEKLRDLTGLTCAADGSCVATTRTATFTFDGTGWHRHDTPLPTGWSGVACASDRACFALQRPTGGPPLTPLPLQRWDGSAWSAQPLPPGPDTSRAGLSAVSCVTDTWCLATGRYEDRGVIRPLAERWDGRRWALAAPLSVPEGSRVTLKAVACRAVDRCLAVGQRNVEDRQDLYAARLEGNRWVDDSAAARAAAVAAGVEPVRLDAVSCPADGCVALGFGYVGSVALALDAQGWRALPPPTLVVPGPVQTAGVRVVDLSCASRSSCATAVPALGAGGSLTVWDGTRWSQPAPGADAGADLVGVSCPAPGRCLAVGYGWPDPVRQGGRAATTAAGGSADGAAWTVEPAGPHPLGAVSCTRSERCVALSVPGAFADPTPGALADGLARVDGAWRPPPTPPPPPALPAGAVVTAVSCAPGGTTCVAVGSTVTQPLGYRWTF